MGILNVTPDSFSDGGAFRVRDQAFQHARLMVDQGADIIDVGGESTRPGADEVSVQEELDRILPVIEAVNRELPVPISVDTSKPEVMRAAVAAGAGLVNDVRALQQEGAIDAVVELGVPVCLVHMQGNPGTMQTEPRYTDVVADIKEFLSVRVDECAAAGIDRSRILVDPGFGFGKTLDHNLDLLRHLDEIQALGFPVVAGLSRKSMIGKVLGLPVERRTNASLALAVLAAWQGANVVRVHDVGPTVEAIRMHDAVRYGTDARDGT